MGTLARTYRGTDDQIPKIRHWVTEHVPHELADVIGLVVTEAATNAIRHTRSGLDGGTLTVAIRPLDDGVRITVTDQGDTDHRPDDPDRLGGNGVQIIHALSASCGLKGGPNGHTQWADFRST